MQLGEDLDVQFTFCLNSSGTCAIARHLNTLKKPRLGGQPNQASNGVISPRRAECGDRLARKTAHLTAEEQNPIGRPAAHNITEACSMIVQITCSASPFICGAYGCVRHSSMPLLQRCNCKSSPINSPSACK